MNSSAIRRASPQAIETVIATLTSLLGKRAVSTEAVREQHSHGEGLHTRGLPDVVAYPQNNEEVAAILACCNANRVPVVPFGAGSSLEGQLIALAGGVSLDMSLFNAVLEVSPEALDCRVQAGVTREALNSHLRDTGLFFPVDPGANASIGGMASTRASGTNAVMYGTMRENILGLTVVTPSGQVIRTGTRARKSAAGLDLTHLYVGSEGTLGVITEIQLKLYPIPESIIAAVCQFETLENAIGAVIAALQSGLKLSRIELLDTVQMRALIRYSKLEYAEKPTLFLEFVGSQSSAQESQTAMREIANDFGGESFRMASSLEDRNKLWKARHNAHHACLAYAPGSSIMSTDACVPISNLSACLLETRADADQSGLTVMMCGHVGDGNFHLGILYDADNPSEVERAEGLSFRVSRRSIAMGGTCSGEHGIGTHKIVHMRTEHGDAVEVMSVIKQALDPNNIMNPGKMLPAASTRSPSSAA